MAARVIYSRQKNGPGLDDSEVETEVETDTQAEEPGLDDSEFKAEGEADGHLKFDKRKFDREIYAFLEVLEEDIRKYSNSDVDGNDPETNSDYPDSLKDLLAKVDETNHERLSDNPLTILEQGLRNFKTVTKTKSCTDCSSKRRVEDVNYLKKGQHISFSGRKAKFYLKSLRKQVKLYSHHAIVKQVVSSSNQRVKLVLIHFWERHNEGLAIRETEESFNLEFDELYIVEYVQPRYSPEEIVLRAEKENVKKRKFQKYCPVTKNCEHFATWCVVGEEVSFQIQDALANLSSALSSLLGEGSKVADYISRLLRPITGFVFVSTDEIATGVSSAAGHSKEVSSAMTNITLAVTSGLYLIYCIVMTAYYIKQYRNRTMCWSCFKFKLLNLWIGFGVFGVTSMITYLVDQFALPLLAPAVGIPVLCLLLVLSTAAVLLVPKITKKFQSPLKLEGKPISALTDLHRGDIVNFKYYTLPRPQPHYFIITDVEEYPHPSTSGKIKCIHYSLPGIFRKRVVTEEDFDIDLGKISVKRFDFSRLRTYSSKEVVRRARKRVGETKWNPASNRSDHLCHWVKMDYRQLETHACISEEAEVGDSRSTTLSSVFIETRNVHLIQEMRPGDVIQLHGESILRDKGILVGLTDLRDGRKFELQIIMQKDRVRLVKETVDLDKHKLFVRRYHPAHCIPMEERVQRAFAMIGRCNRRWTQSGFIEDCILKNPQGINQI